MSTLDPSYVRSPLPGLQPVQYDLDEYRQFVEALNADLVELEAQHAMKRRHHRSETAGFDLDRSGLGDSEPLGPSQQASG